MANIADGELFPSPRLPGTSSGPCTAGASCVREERQRSRRRKNGGENRGSRRVVEAEGDGKQKKKLSAQSMDVYRQKTQTHTETQRHTQTHTDTHTLLSVLREVRDCTTEPAPPLLEIREKNSLSCTLPLAVTLTPTLTLTLSHSHSHFLLWNIVPINGLSLSLTDALSSNPNTHAHF